MLYHPAIINFIDDFLYHISLLSFRFSFLTFRTSLYYMSNGYGTNNVGAHRLNYCSNIIDTTIITITTLIQDDFCTIKLYNIYYDFISPWHLGSHTMPKILYINLVVKLLNNVRIDYYMKQHVINEHNECINSHGPVIYNKISSYSCEN